MNIKFLPICCWEPQNVINSDHGFQSFTSESSHKYAVLQHVQSATVNTFSTTNASSLILFKTITWRQNNTEHTCSVCGGNAQRYTLLHSTLYNKGYVVAQMVKALRYKP
jgi:hypothetical protein